MFARSLSTIEQTTPAEQATTHRRRIRRVSPVEQVAAGERVSMVKDVIPAEQVTPRVAVGDAAAAWYALLPSASRERLLAVMDLLGELAELVPPSGRSWDATRQPSGAFALEFGAVAVRYRIDESDASLVIEGVSPHPR